MSDELKACPFCGSQPERVEQTITDGTVQCLICEGRMTKADLPTAIAQWNTRPNPRSEEMVESLQRLADKFRAWINIGPNAQPHFADGMRPFSTGDLKHYAQMLEAAAKLLSTIPAAMPDEGVERIRASIEKERRKWFCSGDDCSDYDCGRDEGIELALRALDAALKPHPPVTETEGNGE